MVDVFQTDDGDFHQAVLGLNGLVLVHLVVERFALKSQFLVQWEWVVWPGRGLWDDSETSMRGLEPSLARATQHAFDAGITMLADIARDCAPFLDSTPERRAAQERAARPKLRLAASI